MNTKIFTSLILTIILFYSCQKAPGEGGTAVITGKVFALDYANNFLIDSFYAPEHRVYIIYGDNSIYNDDMRTHFDGSYRFEYLYPGDYTLYTYGDCDTCPSGKIALKKEINIATEGEIVEVSDFRIRE